MTARRQLSFSADPCPDTVRDLNYEFSDPVLRASVLHRFDDEAVDDMTDEQYGEWVSGLPRGEIFALLGFCFEKEDEERKRLTLKGTS